LCNLLAWHTHCDFCAFSLEIEDGCVYIYRVKLIRQITVEDEKKEMGLWVIMINWPIVVTIAAFIGLIWVIRRSETCFGVVINVVLLVAAIIAAVLLITVFHKNFGF